jgi:hypothetical protein
MGTIDISTRDYWDETPYLKGELNIQDDGSLLLSVAAPKIPESVSRIVTEYGLLYKEEYHITILRWLLLDILTLKPLCDPSQSWTLEKIRNLARQYAWEYRLQNKFYQLTKIIPPTQISQEEEARMSVIQIVDMYECLSPFYKYIARLAGLTQLELPLAHITLATGSTNSEKIHRGIGVYGESHFATLSPREIY